MAVPAEEPVVGILTTTPEMEYRVKDLEEEEQYSEALAVVEVLTVQDHTPLILTEEPAVLEKLQIFQEY